MVGCAIFGEAALRLMAGRGWNIPSIYSSVFDLFSILTGLLFAVYGIVLTGANPFMVSLRRTRVYARYRGELRRSIYLGFAVTLATVPLLIVEPKEVAAGSWLGLALSLWAGCVVSGFHLFVRVARNFIVMVDDVPQRQPLAG